MRASKKIAVLAVAVTASLGLAACGGGQAPAGGGKVDDKSKTAKSVADFGKMEDLEKAALAEGQLNVIALPHDWSNWGKVISAFKKKYPGITINEANPNASSKEEIDAATTNKGTDRAPDVFDLGANVAVESKDMFAPYKVKAWEDIPAAQKHEDGLYYADYTGIMAVGWNKTKYGDINGLDDLMDKKFANTVALNGKPAEAGSAFNGFISVTLGKGGDIDNLQPGLDYFKALKTAGNLNTIDVTNATIDSGETGVVFDWSYNHASHRDRLSKQGVEWAFKVLDGTETASYYYQAINADAPHPAAARLWMEFLYTPEAQNLWGESGATPVLFKSMKSKGTASDAALAAQPTVSKDPYTYTVKDSEEATQWLAQNWEKAVGN